MTESAAEDKNVFCRRVQRALSVQEHKECPYCFAKLAGKVETGVHDAFCDYQEGLDPITFGFPEGSTRSNEG